MCYCSQMHKCYFIFNFRSPIIPFVVCWFRINYETMGPLTFTSTPQVEDQTIPGHVYLSTSKCILVYVYLLQDLELFLNPHT